MSADYVIRGGTIVDGTGRPPYVGDVAVTGGKISAVGPELAVTGAHEVQANGKHVTPGWVDPHTHYDAQVMWDPMVSPSSANGVTTVVMGNCGPWGGGWRLLLSQPVVSRPRRLIDRHRVAIRRPPRSGGAHAGRC